MSLLNPFSWFKKKPIKVYTHLDEKTLKENEIIKQQQQKISSQEAQLSKVYAIEKEKKDKSEDKKKVNEFNKKLQEQKAELDAHKHGKVIKLSKFYTHLLKHKKFRNKLEICDKNDEVVLSKFGDFGIMGGGKLCIIDDKGELMAYGKTLSHILYKPDAFENMARRGRFLIPMDKDGNWIEDIEYKEIPEPLDAEFDEDTGKIKRIVWSKVKTSDVKKVIAEKMEQINNLSNEVEMKEGIIIKQKQKIDDLSRSLKGANVEYDIAQSELSKNINKFIEGDKRIGDMHIQITKLTEHVSTLRNLLDRKDEIIDRMMEKLDITGDPNSDRLKENIHNDLKLYKELLPEKVEIKQESPPEPKPIVQPGEVIKQ